MKNTKLRKPLILILEDQPDTLFAIKKALRADFDTVEASLISEAMGLLQSHNVSAFLLDLDLPDGSSFDLIEKIKSNPELQMKPIMMLTASDKIEDIVIGFDMGIDDFISKPFNTFELRARLKNRILKLESFKTSSVDTIKITEILSVNLRNFAAILNIEESNKEKNISLTRSEVKILELLHKSSPNHVSRQKLCDLISETESFETRKVDQHIKNLRKKLLPASVIKSSYGFGYYIDKRN
jgi:DNA-binding response OmpR family regulator